MTELTPEQIADGWKITSGRIAQAFDTLPFPFQTMNFVGHISPVFIHGDGEPYWPEVVAYRTFSPDKPDPAAKAVAWQWRYTDLDKWETANSPIDPVAISELKLETRTLYLHPAPASSELIREIERIIALPESNRKDSAREYWKARVEYIQGCLSDALDKAKAYWRDGR